MPACGLSVKPFSCSFFFRSVTLTPVDTLGEFGVLGCDPFSLSYINLLLLTGVLAFVSGDRGGGTGLVPCC